ncbi:MAG TPA: DUF1634 domain-containing protein [Cyanobacteria bacterium UBA11149]|nr:DUF1634 domain-containing protein [Cyanobacteria bacterium UBA11367]HBE60341.1 DUF1634 domain-containing protein [Cyanobacteria bacterium UBA11366]HBK66647.1 DUF1634 domain-containing protein [Cyanobacteria bacterium UBA11166]HBR75417.1 DUF1634 domain-containing protein [Cyanobacteria bacterium UBA11159]HBS71861.1 DUF1634 domain-containing protein [Cyanobacteria bacterium UBA11153]HBW89681.1 DUF1634 domain-containing protein [Cyanobacteria bacterium UBA11149]HCA97041.1 DUF1634 domain-conta
MDELNDDPEYIGSVILECEVREVLPEIQDIALEDIPDKYPVICEDKQSEILGMGSLAQLLSHLLKYGVTIASFVLLLGSILYLKRHGLQPAEYEVFRGEPSKLRSLNGVVTAVLSGSYRGIIQFGLLLLVATPILRVAVSLLTFLQQRDWIYVAFTFFVLFGLIYSFMPAIL